jgi:colanic acid/amylovoran biosynthesis glycosyltransferase
LAVLPKALYLSELLKKSSIAHIHAHWASTTSTMAYIISKVTGIPWSFTAHRWDIMENNLLKEKIKMASFVRVISDKGREELMEIGGQAALADKVLVIHMGVVMPAYDGIDGRNRSDIFTILCPANFSHVKGHKYLLKACQILFDKGVKFQCLLAGGGPLENELRNIVKEMRLDNYIIFLGKLPHEELLDLYRKGEINAVILPSIVTENGEKEGIPVALMEAMSYCIPVISTNTGSIPELIGGGSGVMVEERHPEALASAIERLKDDSISYREISIKCREKVEEQFNIFANAGMLLRLFMQ